MLAMQLQKMPAAQAHLTPQCLCFKGSDTAHWIRLGAAFEFLLPLILMALIATGIASHRNATLLFQVLAIAPWLCLVLLWVFRCASAFSLGKLAFLVWMLGMLPIGTAAVLLPRATFATVAAASIVVLAFVSLRIRSFSAFGAWLSLFVVSAVAFLMSRESSADELSSFAEKSLPQAMSAVGISASTSTLDPTVVGWAMSSIHLVVAMLFSSSFVLLFCLLQQRESSYWERSAISKGSPIASGVSVSVTLLFVGFQIADAGFVESLAWLMLGASVVFCVAAADHARERAASSELATVSRYQRQLNPGFTSACVGGTRHKSKKIVTAKNARQRREVHFFTPSFEEDLKAESGVERCSSEAVECGDHTPLSEEITRVVKLSFSDFTSDEVLDSEAYTKPGVTIGN